VSLVRIYHVAAICPVAIHGNDRPHNMKTAHENHRGLIAARIAMVEAKPLDLTYVKHFVAEYA
jgi:hypothetical protein